MGHDPSEESDTMRYLIEVLQLQNAPMVVAFRFILAVSILRQHDGI